MYAYSDNGTLRLMASLPSRLRLPDGLTRTSLDGLEGNQLAELGIYPAMEDKPPIDTAKQFYGEPKLAFDGKAVTATYPVLDKPAEQIAEELAGAKVAKLAELADARWDAETAGIVLPDGTEIKTDRESQSLLIGAAVACLMDSTSTIEWKGGRGKWVDLDSNSVLQVASLVRHHVQAQFSKERDLGEKVGACASVAEVNAIVWS